MKLLITQSYEGSDFSYEYHFIQGIIIEKSTILIRYLKEGKEAVEIVHVGPMTKVELIYD
jgi:hypothetical protein